ncbi:MAG: hypothetical protein IT284_02520 [Bacteroidetes bacterium]|nr:hypothetical protein [Bacteroidota bacterium]
MKNVQKPGKRFMTQNGNMCVNFHNTFFFMDRLGNYKPWSQTLHHGKLMPQQEWMRLRDLSGGPETVKELTPYLNNRAKVIAENLQKDPFYEMSEEAKQMAITNQDNYQKAQAEGISVDEYLRRKEIRNQREQKRLLRQQSSRNPEKVPVVKVKISQGRTSFLMSSLPGFSDLAKKFANTGS